MPAARLFLSQSVLDRWLSDGTADVSGETLTIQPAAHQFELRTAVLFEREVTESNDKHSLLGRVKDLEQITELGGDYSVGTVILGEEAYEVTDGFVGIAMKEGDLLPTLASLAPPPSTGRTTDPDLATAVGVSSPGALEVSSSAGTTAAGTTAAGTTAAGTTAAGASAPSSAGSASAAGDLAAAINAATPGAAVPKENELDLLARFFLEKR